MTAKERIAQRAARELHTGDVVNLGIGLPNMVVQYLPEEIQLQFMFDNGAVGDGYVPEPGQEDADIQTAGGTPLAMREGAAFFDSSMSFLINRGGHIDCTILGALEVDAEGNLANWSIPGKRYMGMGGAMDLTTGARRVIVVLEHTAQGKPRILPRCKLPLTAAKQVDLIITELGVFRCEKPGLVLTELAKGATLERVTQFTPAPYAISPDLLREAY